MKKKPLIKEAFLKKISGDEFKTNKDINNAPWKYKKDKHNISLEIGMFAKVLTGLCLENNLGVSYQLCFKDWKYFAYS